MKKFILIVEDEKEIADTLAYTLSSEGFDTQWVDRLSDAQTYLASKQYAFIILDIGLPDGSGFDLLKGVRKGNHINSDTPCLFLSARNDEIDRIIGLEIGADDYVCKPFSPREVASRVKVILRRLEKSSDNILNLNGIVPEGSFLHDREEKCVRYQGSILEFTKAEYEIMLAFIEQPNRVFSRRQLIERVWMDNHPSDDRAIDTHIKSIRAKIRSHNAHQEFIITHRGYGYSFSP